MSKKDKELSDFPGIKPELKQEVKKDVIKKVPKIRTLGTQEYLTMSKKDKKKVKLSTQNGYHVEE